MISFLHVPSSPRETHILEYMNVDHEDNIKINLTQIWRRHSHHRRASFRGFAIAIKRHGSVSYSEILFADISKPRTRSESIES